MRIRAPFSNGSLFVCGREIYFSDYLSSDIPEEIAMVILNLRKGYSKAFSPPIITGNENKSDIPVNKNGDKKEADNVVRRIQEKYFSPGEEYLTENNKYFDVFKDYFTFSVAKHRDNVDVSIVLPTCDRFDLMLQCIKSVYEYTKDISFEIVMVDGGDDIQTFRHYMKHAGFFIIKEFVRQGIIKAFNRGFRNSVGKYIVWLNDDVIVEKDWLKIALQYMENNKDAGLGAFYYKEKYWEKFNKPKPVERAIYDGEYLVQTLGPTTFHPNRAYANFGIIKNELIRRLGYWNEIDYKSYVGDTELSHRVWDIGLKVLPIKGARLTHLYHTDKLREENGMVYPKEHEAYIRRWCRVL